MRVLWGTSTFLLSHLARELLHTETAKLLARICCSVLCNFRKRKHRQGLTTPRSSVTSNACQRDTRTSTWTIGIHARTTQETKVASLPSAYLVPLLSRKHSTHAHIRLESVFFAASLECFTITQQPALLWFFVLTIVATMFQHYSLFGARRPQQSSREVGM